VKASAISTVKADSLGTVRRAPLVDGLIYSVSFRIDIVTGAPAAGLTMFLVLSRGGA